MIAASRPVQRPKDARLMVIDALGGIVHAPRASLVHFLRPCDLVIANDAATLPASLQGRHLRSGARIEVRLAGRRSLDVDDVTHFIAVVFGEGDFRTRTEMRPPPPRFAAGDRLVLGPLQAVIQTVLDHPRLVALRFEGTPEQIWEGLARHGRPIQYAHMEEPLALWDVWTRVASLPVAFEPPSAGFVLTWRMVGAMRDRGVRFATLTHAAGISSTGDEALDRRLPFDEPYRIPASTAHAIRRTRTHRGRVVAIGTTVTRALEHAAARDGQVWAGAGLATQRIGATTRISVVDAILSGTHEPSAGHYQLLRAFTDDTTLARADKELDAHGYRTHEFGDSVLIERRFTTKVTKMNDRQRSRPSEYLARSAARHPDDRLRTAPTPMQPCCAGT